MADRPQPDPLANTRAPVVESAHRSADPREKRIHHVTFTAFPKLLYVWPLIVAGFAFWPAAEPPQSAGQLTANSPARVAQSPRTDPSTSQPAMSLPANSNSVRLERLGWAYIWIALLVVLALGVDLGRNQAL